MSKKRPKRGLKICLCGCGKYFKQKKGDHHFYSNKCRYRYWTPIRRDLNKVIKKMDHVMGLIIEMNRVTLDLTQFTAGLDKRIKALESLKTAEKKVTCGKPTIFIMPDIKK